MFEQHTRGQDKSRIAFVELPGKGKFFIYKGIYHDPKYGISGSAWLIDSQAGDQLVYYRGIDEILSDPKYKEFTGIFMTAQETIGDKPGLFVDYYNDPIFVSGIDEISRAYGTIDALANANLSDPLVASVREMIQAILHTRAEEVKSELGKQGEMRVSNVFFDKPNNPEKVITAVFYGYNYTVTDKQKIPNGVRIETSFPLSQFSE